MDWDKRVPYILSFLVSKALNHSDTIIINLPESVNRDLECEHSLSVRVLVPSHRGRGARGPSTPTLQWKGGDYPGSMLLLW